MKVVVRILGYLRPYRLRILFIYVALFSALGIQLTIPTVLGRAIDDGLIARNETILLHAALLIVGLTAVQGFLTFLRTYLIQALCDKIAYDIRNELLAHLQQMSFAFYDRAQTGQLMSRATEDINNIGAMLVMSMRPLVFAIGTFIAVSVILLRTDALLGLVALAPLPILICHSVRFGFRVRPMFSRVQQQFGVMTSALQENVAGSRVVRAFAQEQAENDRFETELLELFERNLDTSRRWSFAYPLTLFLSGLGLCMVLWIGGHRVISGSMSIGTLAAFNRYMIILNEPVRWLGFVINRIARAVASGERIFETLDSRPAILERPNATAPHPLQGKVEFDNVSYLFAGTRRNAVEHISFIAEPGTVTALVGPTGSGKSTIANLIPRFYDVTSGCVLIDGHDVRDLRLSTLRGQIGIIPQETFLFSVSIRENIAHGKPGATMEEIVAAARAARAHDFIVATPNGYDTEVGERGVSLSGGQKQRIAIARALLLNPRILILDDATSSVDIETEREIQAALRVLMVGRTSFVIAHRAATVRDAGQILVFEHGRIVGRGTHDQLIHLPGFYRELEMMQRETSTTEPKPATLIVEGAAS